ncbi:transcriptional regulator [Flavobacterium cerinum]|uniref:Transcriptional regulator n=1 Tax=Flavobacterium cerinum TaxID=2502784 RepID=A0ABY5ISA2_9FLAO|nr:transcriptional regulator [Flavobacterium cerinum]UUC45732.1 transcriptional regulator [Flavobacterium cerinum]
MKTHFDIEQLVEKGVITNEMDFERALIAERKLRILSKDSLHFKNLRKKLRDLLEAYERKEWSDLEKLTDEKMAESDLSEKLAEKERIFIENRKQLIRNKLKTLNLTQKELGTVLGHKSKTHMSELMNGIKPFTLKDLIVINCLLKINMKELIPVFLSKEDIVKIKTAIKALGKEDLILCSY